MSCAITSNARSPREIQPLSGDLDFEQISLLVAMPPTTLPARGLSNNQHGLFQAGDLFRRPDIRSSHAQQFFAGVSVSRDGRGIHFQKFQCLPVHDVHRQRIFREDQMKRVVIQRGIGDGFTTRTRTGAKQCLRHLERAGRGLTLNSTRDTLPFHFPQDDMKSGRSGPRLTPEGLRSSYNGLGNLAAMVRKYQSGTLVTASHQKHASQGHSFLLARWQV